MMGRTHAMLGVSSLWLLAVLPPEVISYNWGALAACAAFEALIPDLDATESIIKHLQVGGVKPFWLASRSLHRTLGHRGLLHSLAGWGLCAVLSVPLIFCWHWLPWLTLLLGYGSHLVGDLCTVTGLPILYPKRQRYYLLPRPLRLVTGSVVEEAVFVAVALTAIALLLMYLPLAGTASF